MKKLIFTSVVTLIFISSLLVAAPGRMRPGRPGPGNGGNHGPGGHYQRDVVRKYIGRQYRKQILPLRQLLGIGPEYRGRRVVAVIMNASTRMGFGRAQLLVNGGGVGYPERVPEYNTRVRFEPRYGENIIGRDIRSLQIRLQGNFWVDSLAVRFAPEYDPFDPYLDPDMEEFIGEYVYNRDNFAIRQILGIGPRYRGKRVKWVMMSVKAERGNVNATLFINGRPVGRPQPIRNTGRFSRTQDLVFRLNPGQNVIGTQVRSIQIQIRTGGRAYVESAGIKFAGCQF